MPEEEVRTRLTPKIVSAEKRLLLQFLLLSALMHAAPAAFLIRAGAEIPPPLRIMAVDIHDPEPFQQQTVPRLASEKPGVDSTRRAAPKAAAPPISVAPEKTAPMASVATSPPGDIPHDPSPGQTSSQNNMMKEGLQGAPSAVPANSMPAGTALATAGPEPAIAASSGTASYLSLCRALIEKNKDYPVMARRGRIEGAVTVRCVLMRDGSIRNSGVLRSSGSTLLDNAALKAVRGVGRFPPLPAGIQGRQLIIEIPLSFRLATD